MNNRTAKYNYKTIVYAICAWITQKKLIEKTVDVKDSGFCCRSVCLPRSFSKLEFNIASKSTRF